MDFHLDIDPNRMKRIQESELSILRRRKDIRIMLNDLQERLHLPLPPLPKRYTGYDLGSGVGATTAGLRDYFPSPEGRVVGVEPDELKVEDGLKKMLYTSSEDVRIMDPLKFLAHQLHASKINFITFWEMPITVPLKDLIRLAQSNLHDKGFLLLTTYHALQPEIEDLRNIGSDFFPESERRSEETGFLYIHQR